ncbi:hypothetical protein C1H46_039931 [Malus baccata]|uniref:MLO-like protein n=1 Tax=Malus baccata TaxID=106549 RepID=A0A540KJY0_MALBA|nr:hypothetical protein C1H46_039931 [Malus baccata]
MAEDQQEMRSLALTPTWSVATVLTIFVAVSLLVERGIHRLSYWLRKTNRKPLLEAVEKMKEELMLLGFISLLLTATSSMIANICIPSKFYNSSFSPCSRSEITEETENKRKLLMFTVLPNSFRRVLNELNRNSCKEGYEPFVSYQGLEQLHRFIFVMAITHISYSCLTMLLAIVKIHSWRVWEEEAHKDRHDSLTEITRQMTMRRQSSFVNPSTPVVRNNFFIWVRCFFRQFGNSVVRADYLTLRMGFITNHNLSPKYDFHSYMIRSMEEEFQRIVGVSATLWGFVVAFMLFNVKGIRTMEYEMQGIGSNLYFWIAIIPITLVLLVGMKLQHIIATLALENAGITGSQGGAKLRPRDDLFWFKKPELLFAGQFLCSYSTLPLYALVTQMGTNYKAAIIPQRIRETIHGWGKAARRKRRLGTYTDDSTIRTETSTVASLEEDDHQMIDYPADDANTHNGIELQPVSSSVSSPCPVGNQTSSRPGTPLLRPSASVSSQSVTLTIQTEGIPRSASLPARRE